MAVASGAIRITGLRELQASLKQMDGQSQKRLRLVLNKAAEGVASGARAGVPRRRGRAAASIRVASSQREARVKAGGAKAVYYGWLEFGGSVGRRGSVKRPFVTKGRYIYPAYDSRRGSIQDMLQKGIVDLARDSGLEVS